MEVNSGWVNRGGKGTLSAHAGYGFVTSLVLLTPPSSAFFTSLFMGSSIKERREDLERVLPTTMD